MKTALKLNQVPDGYTSVTPWIISPSTDKMINFLKAVFNAQEVPNSRIIAEDGVVIHAVVKISDATIMLFDARNGWGSTPAFLNIYVENVKDVFQKAIVHGAISVTEITPLWFGEKVCRILDPFGNLFWINERIEEVDFTDPAEVQKRSSTPEAVEGIVYIQKSLDEALKMQKIFLSTKRYKK